MHFILQTDNVSVVEKRAVKHASILTDAKLTYASLETLRESIKTGKDISSEYPIDAVPVGTVEFVIAAMHMHFIEYPKHMSYPECLFPFLNRNVWTGEYGDNTDNIFIKPRHDIKYFTGALRNNIEPCKIISLHYPVWFSDPVKFVSEWRYYITNGKVVGAGRYDDGDDDNPVPDIEVVQAAVDTMSKNGCPAGYALDFGILEDGRTTLVEANDGWSVGFYKGNISTVNYAKLLHARWTEMAHYFVNGNDARKSCVG